MGDKWKEYRIGEIAEVIGGGTPSTKDDDNFGGDIPWLTPKDLSGHPYRYISYGERNITEKGLSNSSAKLLPEKTVLLTTRAPVGYVAIAKNPVTTNQGFRSLVLRSGFDPEFLYYLLKANTEYLQNHASGKTFGELSGSTLKSLQFLFPPLPEQKAIASILGALDDKIELNRKMNETLEAMARAIFKSWFVDFDPIPGIDPHKEWQNSPLGKIPKGWSVGSLKEIVELQRYSINPMNFPNEIFDHYSIPAFDEGQMPTHDLGSTIKSNKFLLPNKYILISKLNPRIPRIWFPKINKTHRSVASTEFLVLIPKSQYTIEFIYSLCVSASFQDTFISLVTGTSSSHQRVKPSDLSNMEVVCPSDIALKEFTQKTQPLFVQIQANKEQSLSLSSIRDALLPKLLSGEIRVKDTEKFVGKAL